MLKNNNLKIFAILGLIAVCSFSFVYLFGKENKSDVALSGITVESPTPEGLYRFYKFFATSSSPYTYATTTNATSTNIVAYTDSSGRIDNGSLNIVGAKKVEFYFDRKGTLGNTGNSLFKIQVTPDGTNWHDFSKLVLATSTSQATQETVQIGASTSTVVTSLNLDFDTFYAVRCIVVETTDGEHSCSAAASW